MAVRDSVNDRLDDMNVSRQDILRAAYIIRADAANGMGSPSMSGAFGNGAAMDGNSLLDRALSILIHLPDDPSDEMKIRAYAFGKFRGRPGMVVERFWNRVPERAMSDMVMVTVARFL